MLKRPKLKKFLLKERKKEKFKRNGKVTQYNRKRKKKKKWRLIDFNRRLFNSIPAIFKRKIIDPNRNIFLALILYVNGFISYILSPEELKLGQHIMSSNNENILNKTIKNWKKLEGISIPIILVPSGKPFFNIQINRSQGGQLLRAPGSYAYLLQKEKEKTYIRLKKRKVLKIPNDYWITLGKASKPEQRKIKLFKAGNKIKKKGIRPTVRGVAMNPIDHPHGGGGRSNFRWKEIFSKFLTYIYKA